MDLEDEQEDDKKTAGEEMDEGDVDEDARREDDDEGQ